MTFVDVLTWRVSQVIYVFQLPIKGKHVLVGAANIFVRPLAEQFVLLAFRSLSFALFLANSLLRFALHFWVFGLDFRRILCACIERCYI